MDNDLKHNLIAKETWIRGLFILLFAFLLAVARMVTWAVVLLQFLFTLFTGRTNDNLLKFGDTLARYIWQCFLFVTFNSDDKPFPFDDWPVSGEEKPAPQKAPEKKTAAKKAAPKKSRARKSAASAKSKQSKAKGSSAESSETGSDAGDKSGGTS